MADLAITRALASATRRGVSVNILMTSSTDWTAAFTQLASAGAHIRTYAPDARLYIHAKMIAADGAQAFIGSENFSPTSLDQNRELGIVLSNAAVIQSLAQTFSADWRNATPFTAAKE